MASAMKIQTVANIFEGPYRLRKNGVYNVDLTTAERLILEGRAFDPAGEITAEKLEKREAAKAKASTKKASDKKKSSAKKS